MTAKISSKDIVVRHSVRPEINREFLTVDVPNGWDDVKKITQKVLIFEGRKFTWNGWNSDRNETFFVRPLEGQSSIGFATFE